MNSEDYCGLMRPWYGLVVSGEDTSISENPPNDEAETVESFEFLAVPISHHNQIREQSHSLASLELLQASHERELSEAILARVHCLTHSSFEQLILDVVCAAGFAKGRPDLAHKVGRSGDGGIDGIIYLDDFGLDAIYLQAKRLRPGGVVGAAAVRDFIGSLESHRASKAVFVTTGEFSQPAMEVIKQVSSRIILINGEKLAALMIRHGIGLKKLKAFVFQQVDSLWFQHVELSASESW